MTQLKLQFALRQYPYCLAVLIGLVLKLTGNIKGA